ncbi:hypothetical protein [Solibacillus cecembensis]
MGIYNAKLRNVTKRRFEDIFIIQQSIHFTEQGLEITGKKS